MHASRFSHKFRCRLSDGRYPYLASTILIKEQGEERGYRLLLYYYYDCYDHLLLRRLRLLPMLLLLLEGKSMNQNEEI